MKTYMAKKGELKKKWYVVDAQDKILGKLATRVATVLRGKDKPEYTPHVDCGDGVIVVNASKVKVTGKKLQQKEYITFSGYPSGQKIRTLGEMLKKYPAKVIRLAVKRMLPDTPLGRDMLKKLKVYPGSEHSQNAQKPEELGI